MYDEPLCPLAPSAAIAPTRHLTLFTTLSFLESCGIPAFQNGSLGKVLGGFASQGVEIWVPASQLEEAQALLNTPAEIPEQD